jgi:hypothetical protein
MRLLRILQNWYHSWSYFSFPYAIFLTLSRSHAASTVCPSDILNTVHRESCRVRTNIGPMASISPSLFYLFTAGVEVVYFSLDHTQTHTTVGRTPLDEGSARRRDLYLTTHNTVQETNMHAPGGIRTRNPSKRSAADRAVSGIGGGPIDQFVSLYVCVILMRCARRLPIFLSPTFV